MTSSSRAGIAHRRHAERARSPWVARHQTGVFVVLAFGLSWWPWPLAVAHPDSAAMLPFGPLIAALTVAALGRPAGAVRSLARSVTKWRAPRSTWAIAALGPFSVAAIAGLAALTFGVVAPTGVEDELGWSTWLSLPLLMLATGLLGGPLVEEVGWRGFLLPELQRRHSALWSSGVVGGLWVVWHLPLLVSEPTGQRPPLPFAVGVLAQAVLLTWLYNVSGGSVLVATVFHTAANTASRLVLEPFLGEAGFLGLWWMLASGYVVAAGVVLWRTRGRLGGAATAPGPDVGRA